MNTDYICDGRCCERFYIHMTPEQIKEKFEAGEGHEINIIGPMVIPIEKDNEYSGWWYTCRNFDTETRLCKIYESRPQMCRDYPYGNACENCGSTCGTVKKEPLPAGGVSIPPKVTE